MIHIMLNPWVFHIPVTTPGAIDINTFNNSAPSCNCDKSEIRGAYNLPIIINCQHRWVKVKSSKIVDTATSDCNFVSLSPTFTIFRILVHNDIVDILHDLAAMETILVGNYVLP